MTLACIDQTTDAATRPEQAPTFQTPDLADDAGWSTPDMLADLLCRVFPGRIALVSSFGIESAMLLKLVSRIDRAAPVILLQARLPAPRAPAPPNAAPPNAALSTAP